MSDNKYVLTSDGKLYHAFNGKGWQKKDAKYISREFKNGRWVYTYPEDKNSLKNRTKRAINRVKFEANKLSRKVQYKTGITQAKQYEKVSQQAAKTGGILNERALKDKHEAKKQLMNTPVGKLQNASANVKRRIDKGAAKVAYLLGANEKLARDTAAKQMSKAKSENLKSGTIKSMSLYKQAEDNYHDANATFARTPLGMLESVSKAGKYWLDKIVNGIKDRVDDYKAEKEAQAAAEAAAEVERQRNENKAKSSAAGTRQKDRLGVKEAERDSIRQQQEVELQREDAVRQRQNEQRRAELEAARKREENKKNAAAAGARQKDRLDVDEAEKESLRQYTTAARAAAKAKAEATQKLEDTKNQGAAARARQKDRLGIEDAEEAIIRQQKEAAEEAERRRKELIEKGAAARARQRSKNR